MGLSRQETAVETQAMKDGKAIIRWQQVPGTSSSTMQIETAAGLLAVVETNLGKDGMSVKSSVYNQALSSLVPAELRTKLAKSSSCSLSEEQNLDVAIIAKNAHAMGIEMHPNSDAVQVPVTKLAEDLAKAVQECAAER